MAPKGKHRLTEVEDIDSDSAGEAEVVEASSRRRAAKTPMDATKKGQKLRSLIRSMEASCIRDPEGLLEIMPMIQTAQDVVDVTIAQHAFWRKIGQANALPAAYFATLLGVSEAAISKRSKNGDAILQDRERLAATLKFAEAAHDKARRDRDVAAARERLAALPGGAVRTGTDG